MTAEEAKAKQDKIAKNYSLSMWYGVDCTKCCGVYPILRHSGQLAGSDCYYECEVCGKRTDPQTMPWIARDAWNRGFTKTPVKQLNLFDFMEG